MTTQYRVPELGSFQFQQSVLSVIDAPPGGDSKGDRYIVGTGSGDFAGHDDDIAWYDGASWQFDTPAEGWICWNEDTDTFYVFTTSWASFDPSAGHTQNTDTGTTSATFQLDSGNTGPKLKNNSGVTEIRNAADDAYTNIKANDVVAAGDITDGTYATSPQEINEAYTGRAIYDSDLKCVTFNL
jgi:hypothetical protein